MPSSKNSHFNKIMASHKSSRAARTCVLHLCPNLDPGELGRETVDLAVLTQRSGWRSLIASSGGLLVNEGERSAVHHTRMPLNRQGWLSRWRNRVHLETLVQRERPSLIHAHGSETLAQAYGLSRIHRIPLIVDITQPPAADPALHKVMKLLGNIQATVRVPSEFMAHHLETVFGLEPETIRHIPPGIDLNWHNAGAISPERLQNLSRLWRLPEQAAVLLMPMPLMPGLGHKIFLQALAHLKNEKVFAVLVGHDRRAPGMSAEIENWVDRLGLQGKVIVPEFCTDWPAAYWLSTAVVAPNTAPRGQNIALLAAQAIGRPVIITECGANLEMVRYNETAWVVPPDDAATLADAMLDVIHLTTDQRLMLADNTRFFIGENFPQANWFNRMIDSYEELLHPPAALRQKAKAA